MIHRGISLGQLATEDKSNEIIAIPELLDQIGIEGVVITTDVAGYQTEIGDAPVFVETEDGLTGENLDLLGLVFNRSRPIFIA